MFKKHIKTISLLMIMVFAMTFTINSNISDAATKTFNYKNKSYKVIQVDGGNMSGKRKANVAVDIGYGKSHS